MCCIVKDSSSTLFVIKYLFVIVQALFHLIFSNKVDPKKPVEDGT